MRKISLKLKLTFLYVLFMLIIAILNIAFITFLSRSESRRNMRNALIARLNSNSREVKVHEDAVEISERFVGYRNGIYCLVYDRDGTCMGGQTPDDDLIVEVLNEGPMREVTVNGEKYMVIDQINWGMDGQFWLRGISGQSGYRLGAASTNTAMMISIPLIIVLAGLTGYVLVGRFFRPIQVISKTAEEIGSGSDLSRRIDIDENGDELHALAGTFNRMIDRLESSFNSERQFTSDASHELRTPITTILAQCEYAFEDATDEDELYEIIGDIQKQGYRMSRLVDSLLKFTRLEQHTESLIFENVDLSRCVENICQEARELILNFASEKNITLNEDIQQGIWMKADVTLLSRMLDNLLRNACHYGKENGYIKVKLRQTDEGIILSVADDGIGISEEDLPNIWNRFYRADKARAYGHDSGFGLGLPMVRQIVELHKGTISAESELDKGSTFTIYFPREDAAQD